MKKIIATFIVFCITTSLFALEEVRGVQTRVAKYPATEGALFLGDCNDIYGYDIPSSFAGFELSNENEYSVWVEMELYKKQYKESGKVVPESVVNTKSITLKAKESYLWKVNIVAECLDRDMDRHTNIRPTGDIQTTKHIQNYFIKYKAYKADSGQNDKTPKNKSKKSKKLMEEDDEEEYDEEDSENAGFAVSVAPRQKRRPDRERRLDKEEEEAEIARLEAERRRRDRERDKEREREREKKEREIAHSNAKMDKKCLNIVMMVFSFCKVTRFNNTHPRQFYER